MDRSTKDAWLAPSAGDLKEEDVEDVPVPGKSVRVRGLPAAYSNQAQSEALVFKTQGREQISTIDTGKLEVLQFVHGVTEPKFTPQEAEVVATKFGPAFKKVIAKIDELSGVDKEAIEQAEIRFPAGGQGETGSAGGNGSPPGGGRPDLPARAGARAGDDD